MAIRAPCNALATTSGCVLHNSNCSLVKEGVFLQTVFGFNIGSTSKGTPEVKMLCPEKLKLKVNFFHGWTRHSLADLGRLKNTFQ